MTSKGFYSVIIVLATELCLPTVARSAQSSETTPLPVRSPASDDVIEITVVGHFELFDRMRGALDAQAVAPANLRWLWRARWDPSELISGDGSNQEVLIRCWLVLSDRSHAHLYFADRTAKRFVIRDLDLTGRLDEVDREALSQALELSIRALREDQQAGIDREEARSLLSPPSNPTQPPAAKVPRAPSVTPKRTSGFWASASWQIEGHSHEFGLVQGPGLWLGYERPLAGLRAALWVSGQYQLGETYDGLQVGLALHTLAFRSGLRLVRPLFAGRWFAGAVLGGGVNLAQFAARPGTLDAQAALTPARTSAVPTLCAGALWGAELSQHARLNLALLVNVPLVELHYDVEVAGQAERVVDPWRVRPGLSLAIEWH